MEGTYFKNQLFRSLLDLSPLHVIEILAATRSHRSVLGAQAPAVVNTS